MNLRKELKGMAKPTRSVKQTNTMYVTKSPGLENFGPVSHFLPYWYKWNGSRTISNFGPVTMKHVAKRHS